MKSIVVKAGLSFLFAALIVHSVEAQRTGKRRNSTQPANNQTQTQSQQNNNTQPSGYNPYGNVKIVVDSSGLSDTIVRKSLRNDNAFDKAA